MSRKSKNPQTVSPKNAFQDKAYMAKLRASSSPLRERFIEDMKFHKLAEATQQKYLNHIFYLVSYYRVSPLKITDKQLREYFRFLENDRQYSGSTIGTAHAAMIFFYKYTCQREMPFLKIYRNRKYKKIKSVLSHEEVKTILSLIRNPAYRMCLTLIYSCGLRVGEAVAVKVKDIDSQRGLLHIRKAKGYKDRLVPLPERTLQLLRKHWKTHQHKQLLFPGCCFGLKRKMKRRGEKDKTISASVLLSHFKAALRASDCKKSATLHTLRRSYATKLLEEGVPLLTVKEHLGHSCITSTMIYFHCTSKISRSGTSSIERIMSDL